MQARLIRLRFRRSLRQGQRQVEGLGAQAEENLEEHLFKRFDRLLPIRRFVFAWTGLMVLLIGGLIVQNLSLSGYFQTLGPVPGGIYREGVRGRFTNANPMYATSTADATVSRLIFAGLLTYDKNGTLVGDLASDYSVDARGTTYTVHLKPHLTWQDGQPLTSDDVVFTYQSIENPDAQSPLLSSWQGIAVSAPDKRTIVFKLPGVLASFRYNLTSGIVPKHLLGNIPASELRSADFNTAKPIGAGPFAWQGVQVTGSDPVKAEEQISLAPFTHYVGGQPKLQKFVVRVFGDDKQLFQAFQTNQLTAIEGSSDMPEAVSSAKGVQAHSLLLRAANMVFFKTTSKGPLADQSVRQALIQSANTAAIVKHLGYPTHAVNEALLTGQLAYDPKFVQPKFDVSAAKKTLDAAGWKAGKNGIRVKDKQPLAFTLTADNTPEFRFVTDTLQRQWQAAGAQVTVHLLEPTDFQAALKYHDYDAMLYGITIGLDPDVFVYWDSSQADIRSANRFNLSEYKNSTADAALEAGRTRTDPKLRVIKYRPFLEAWQHDSPALGLYQPRFLYLTNGSVANLAQQPLTSPIDRFDNVQNWEIRQAKVTD